MFTVVTQDAYASPRFRFVQVNLTEFDKRHVGMDWKSSTTCGLFTFQYVFASRSLSRYGVNDVRYFFFHRLLTHNSDWKSVFIVAPGLFATLLY